MNEIEGIYEIEIDKNDFVPQQLSCKIAELTGRINREIAVYVNRKGNVLDISVGDSGTVSLPEVEGRKHKSRLSGVRCIHTHPNGDERVSSVDINSMLSLRLDAMIAIGARDGSITGIQCAIPARNANGEFDSADIYGPFSADDTGMNRLFGIVAEIDSESGSFTHENRDESERAIIVGLEIQSGKPSYNQNDSERSLDELEELARTSGAVVVHRILQKKRVKDSTYYIGKGKAEELSLLRQALNADIIIFDDELSGAQVRNLEDTVGVKVVDRTNLILDIFAQRARSKEGKLQVELAQLKYRLPRLTGLGNQLSRLGGGIGTRGPGEKKLEVDRRHINRRINYLEAELEITGRRRSLMREERKQNSVPVIALVGYTNAGKSTLMNSLCNSDVFAENKLFATLDPTTRSLSLKNGRNVLLTDTVGFIRKLPHDLIEAFKSTLEEAVFADMLIHVVDASSPEVETQIAVVDEILESLGALNKPVIMALNKMDRVKESIRIPVPELYCGAYEVSALNGQGLEVLLQSLDKLLAADEVEVKIFAPYNEGWIPPFLHRNGKVIDLIYEESGIKIVALVKNIYLEKIRDFIV